MFSIALVDEEATFSQTRPATVARPPPPESGDASECSPVELVDQERGWWRLEGKTREGGRVELAGLLYPAPRSAPASRWFLGTWSVRRALLIGSLPLEEVGKSNQRWVEAGSGGRGRARRRRGH